MASIQRILQPGVLTEVISQQMSAELWILQLFGMQPGGANTRDWGHGREGVFRVFNRTRKTGLNTAPGMPAASAIPQNVGDTPFIYPRMHEKHVFPAEYHSNLSRITEQLTRDRMYEEMLTFQTRYAAEKAANWRGALVMGMLRDQLYEHANGTGGRYMNFTSTDALKRLNFNMPAGNQNQLNMLAAGDIITASWADPVAANIPLHVQNIRAAFQQLYGGDLENIMLGGAMWQNVINNDQVADQAGIAAPPFETFDRVVGTREDGSPLTVQVGRISAIPGVTWWITDEGLELGAPGSETFTRFVDVNDALFFGSVNRGHYTMQEAGEPISEYDGQPRSEKRGFNAWARDISDPTATEIFTLDNALAINHIPNSTARGTVVFQE